MKIVKTMTAIAFACACLFSFAGCDLFANSGTLIEEPTADQIASIQAAITTNTQNYDGDLTCVYINDMSYDSTTTYEASYDEKNLSTFKRTGTGENTLISSVVNVSGTSSSVNVSYNISQKYEKYLGKVGNEYVYINKLDQTKRVYENMTALLDSDNINVPSIDFDYVNDLSAYSSDSLKVYALSEDDTSFRVTIETIDYGTYDEATAINKNVISIEIVLKTVNDTLLVSNFTEKVVHYEREEITDDWGANRGIGNTSYSCTYNTPIIVLPDITNYEHHV